MWVCWLRFCHKEVRAFSGVWQKDFLLDLYEAVKRNSANLLGSACFPKTWPLVGLR